MLFSLLAIGLLSGFALADTNPDDNYDDELGGETVVPIVLSSTYYDDARWGNTFAGSQGWSDDTWVLTISGEHGKGLRIRCYDRFWYGDFYSVWIVDTAGDTTVMKLGTTPEVETDYHHSCAANPLHTGTGNVWSDGTFLMFFNPGTYEFKVRNELFHVLWAEGIDPRTPQPWSPAGFYIGFHHDPSVIPEVPLGTVMAGAAMIVALVAYVGKKHTQVFRRRP